MNRRIATLLGATAFSCAAVGGFVACSSNGGGGSDAGPDQLSMGNDATMDTGPGIDASDSGTGMDGAEGGGPGLDGSGDGGGMCAIYDASVVDEASVTAGFVQVWQVYKCWKCHQNPTDLVDDAGNGILLNGNSVGLGDSGTIFPPNLTNSAEGLGCWTDPQITTAILQGRDPQGGTLCPPMPVFGNDASTPGRPMDAGTAQEIIDYIRSLQPSSNTVPDTTCSSPRVDAGADGSTDAAGQ